MKPITVLSTVVCAACLAISSIIDGSYWAIYHGLALALVSFILGIQRGEGLS